jgi:hypothetical protein
VKVPIVLKTGDALPAPGRLYYEVAENGIFQVRDTPLYRAVIRAALPLPGLVASKEELVINFPRLGRAMVEEVLAFFHEANRRYAGEAVVIIFYAVERGEYRLVAPPQRIPGRWYSDGRWRADYSVRYQNVPRADGFIRFGTIHSHADLPAYASGLDCDDERYEDGLHIVFGNFGSPRISVAAAFVAGGVRFEVSPADVLEAARVPGGEARRDWMAQVVREHRGGARPQRVGGKSRYDDASTCREATPAVRSWRETEGKRMLGAVTLGPDVTGGRFPRGVRADVTGDVDAAGDGDAGGEVETAGEIKTASDTSAGKPTESSDTTEAAAGAGSANATGGADPAGASVAGSRYPNGGAPGGDT